MQIDGDGVLYGYADYYGTTGCKLVGGIALMTPFFELRPRWMCVILRLFKIPGV